MRPQTVLILKADRLYADAICRRAHEVWPHATYHLENSVDAAQALVAHRRIDAVLTGLGMLDGDVCNLVDDCSRQSVPAMIALITGRRDPRLLALLGQLPIDGAFDSKEEPPEHLPAALETVARGEGFSAAVSSPG